MKKRNIVLAIVLILLIALVGWQNKRSGQQKEGTVLTENIEQTTKTEVHNGESILGDRVVREYPELGVYFDAQCLSPMEGRDIPGLKANFSKEYAEKMLNNFLLTRYPEASYSDEDGGWNYFGSNGNILGSFTLFEDDFSRNRVYFGDAALDANGSLNDDHRRYNYFLEESQGETYPVKSAMADAISALKPYTDFDLHVFNVGKDVNSSNGAYNYRIRMELAYQGIPISEYGPDVYCMGLDMSIQEKGIAYFQGIFNLSSIRETSIYSCMSLENAMDAFTRIAPDYCFFDRWNIYCIQLEYVPEQGDQSSEYQFRPVWSFYGVSDSDFYSNLKIYADTGAFCNQT